MSILSLSVALFIHAEACTYLSITHGMSRSAPLCQLGPPPRPVRRAPALTRLRHRQPRSCTLRPVSLECKCDLISLTAGAV